MGWGEEGREVRLPRSESYACSYLADGVRKGEVKAIRLARYISVTYLEWSADLYSFPISTTIGLWWKYCGAWYEPLWDRSMNLYWSACEPILRLWQESPALYIYYAKASCAQLPDIPHRSDTQALCLIASIPLIQRREKHRSREGKSVFP